MAFKRILLSLILVLAPLSVTAQSQRQSADVDTVPISDAGSVEEAVARASERLESQGFDIVGVINHGENAINASFDLLPTQLILFSNPRIDRKLIRRGQTAAIELPQKLLVWEDDDGNIQLNYNPPGYLADRHDLNIRDSLLSRVGRTLRQFGELDDGLVDVISGHSVANTAVMLETVLLDAGFIVPFVIDYQTKGYGDGRSLRPTTLIIFGNPLIGSQLMLNSRSIGVDLPQKFLIWEDRDGTVRITYNDPLFIAGRHGIQGLDTLLGNITNALANFANQAAVFAD